MYQDLSFMKIPLPEDVLKLKNFGDYEGALKMIKHFLGKEIPTALRKRLEIEEEIIRVMGSDEYGTFNPDSDIKRSETAAIINRVAIPANRLSKTLKEYNVRDSYMFAYSGGTYGNDNANRATTIRENLASG